MTDEDKTLLEMAAIAAGLTDYRYVAPDVEHRLLTDRGIAVWNPLADDGDALRLAVRLSLLLDTDYNGCAAVGSAWISEILEPHNGDLCASTRRAIVRAAAEIGKAMQ